MLWVSLPCPSLKASGPLHEWAISFAGNCHASSSLLCSGITSFRKQISSPHCDG